MKVRGKIWVILSLGLFVFGLSAVGAEHPKLTVQNASRPTEIQGVPCIGRVILYENGKVEGGTLSRRDTLSEQPLPAGTFVHFDSTGTLVWCFLPRDTTIQGHLCKGYKDNWMTTFYPSGKLRVAWLAQDEVIQGVPCKAAGFWAELMGGGGGTYFYENGTLMRCKLSRAFSQDGHSLRKDNQAAFDADGKLILNRNSPLYRRHI